MNKLDIRQLIETLLVNSTFELTEFSYEPQFFGNMVAVIYNDTKVYKFTTDRGEIWCNQTLIFPNDYHVKGRDDTPEYLMKAIQNLIDEKEIKVEQASETTRKILDEISDLIDMNQVLISSDVKETKKGPIKFESVILDAKNKIRFVVYADGDIWTSYLHIQKYYYALNFESDEEVIQEAILTFKTIYTALIKVITVYKGDKLMKRTLYFNQGKEWEWIGVKYYVTNKLINPFAKTVNEEVIYDFRKKA